MYKGGIPMPQRVTKKPETSVRIPLTRPEVGLPEARAVMRVLKSHWLTQGPEVEALEREFADYVGASDACAVSSATAALHLALRALGVKPGDEVIVPSHTFIATVNVILYCGAIPRFVDIDLNTYCISPQAISAQITPRTSCIIIVHQMGIPCHLSHIVEVAAKYHLPIVEDAACALGSEYLWGERWERIGKPHGHIACFSFHPRKIITCGEGGMITCRDSQLLNKIRKMRQHGLDSPSALRAHLPYCSHPPVRDLGYNYRLSDIAAAILRCQLRRLPTLIQRRRALAAKYNAAFSKLASCHIVNMPYTAKSNYQSYPLRLNHNAPISRNELIQRLAEADIESKPGIMNVHEVATYLPDTAIQLPRSELASRQTILLPLYPSLTEQQQQKIITLVTSLLERN